MIPGAAEAFLVMMDFTLAPTPPAAEYQAARAAVALLDRPETCALRLSGATRLDFLQRQTTNDLKPLRPGQAIITILTNPQARILAALTVLARPDDFLIFAGPPLHQRLARYFSGMIFFMDQVAMTEVSAEMRQYDLLGPQAPACLAVAAAQPAVTDLPLFAWRTLTVGGQEVTAVRLPGPGADAFRLLIPASGAAAVQAALQQAGACPIGWPAFDALRIEAGLPEPGLELTDAVTPLEAGLQAYVSATKGCYTGQEVIARQLTYDKVMRHLCGLLLAAPASSGATLEAGGRAVGVIASATQSPALGRPIALAFVRRDHAVAGALLDVRSLDGQLTQAQVTDLPFVEPS